MPIGPFVRAASRPAIVAAALMIALSGGGCSVAVDPQGDRPETPAPEPPSGADGPDASPLFGWRCDDGAVLVTRFDAATRRLLIDGPDGRRVMESVPVASGAAWRAGEERFWNRGEAALFERRASETTCRIDPVRSAEARAAEAGVLFRALGNEPGWSLEVHPDRLVWVSDWGATRRVFDRVDPGRLEERGGVLVGRGDAGTLRVRIDGSPCVDDGDRSWPASVTLGHEGRELGGCGRPLAPLDAWPE